MRWGFGFKTHSTQKMASKVSAVAKFISHKVSAVCWEPGNTVGVLKAPSLFGTGSWDDSVSSVF